MYSVDQVCDLLMRVAQGERPDEEWLRSIEGAGAIEGQPGVFGLEVAGQEFFVTVEQAA